MECETGRCSKTSTPYGIFIATPSLEEWPTKAKEAPFPHEVSLAPLDTNPGEAVELVLIILFHVSSIVSYSRFIMDHKQ